MKRLGCMIFAICLGIWGLIPVAHAAEPTYPGKSWCLMDAATGTVIQAGNEHEALAPASVTKIMTLLLIMEAIDSDAISWQDTVTASEAAAAKGGSQIYLKVGEQMSVEDMVKSIAISSANDCACAMAEFLAGTEEAFVEQMNAKAQALGMADTYFVNCTGLDDSENAKEHKTSAYDIALMSRELLTAHPEIKRFSTTWMDSVRNGRFGLNNTNKLVRFYDGCTGLKTGFTSSAGYCLSASAQREDLELIAVIMGSPSSTERFSACRQMLDFGFATYCLYHPSLPEELSVPVKLGKQDRVYLELAQATPLLLKKRESSRVRLSLTQDSSVTAPVSPGQELGQLELYLDDTLLAQIPLQARDGVEKLGFWDLYKQLLAKIAMSG